MPVMKFKRFEDLDKLESEGKGVTWKFAPDKDYREKALKFRIRIPFPPGLYRFETFEEAASWEMEWWIRNGATKRAD